jgi:hypothetical protein
VRSPDIRGVALRACRGWPNVGPAFSICPGCSAVPTSTAASKEGWSAEVARITEYNFSPVLVLSQAHFDTTKPPLTLHAAVAEGGRHGTAVRRKARAFCAEGFPTAIASPLRTTAVSAYRPAGCLALSATGTEAPIRKGRGRSPLRARSITRFDHIAALGLRLTQATPSLSRGENQAALRTALRASLLAFVPEHIVRVRKIVHLTLQLQFFR